MNKYLLFVFSLCKIINKFLYGIKQYYHMFTICLMNDTYRRIFAKYCQYTHPRWKIYLCVTIFFIACLSLYCAVSTLKPMPTMKLFEKGRAYVSNQLDRYSVRTWNYIIIHHSATESGNAAEFDKFHRMKRGWKYGLGYHFVIGNGNGSGNGQIEIGERWIKQKSGAHVGIREYNQYGIGICVVGNFNESYPTKEQMASLIILVQYLQKRCNIGPENIIMHRDCKATDCPGKNFPIDALQNYLVYATY